MIKLIKNIMIIAALFILIDRLVAYTIYYVAERNAYDTRLGNILQNSLGHKDVLLIGSSRTARGLIAKDIEDKTGLSVYNLSYLGTNIDFHLELLKLVINTGVIPKIVVLGIDDKAELIESDSIKFNTYHLSPYSNYSKIRNMLHSHENEPIFMSKYIYTYKLGNNLSIMLPNKNPDKSDILQKDGSMPVSGKSNLFKDTVYNNNTSYDANKESSKLRKKFIEFVNTCKINNIQLIVLFIPNFYEPSNEFISRIKHLIGNDAYGLNCSRSITDKESFYNDSHLNEKGAKILSLKVSAAIKNIHNSTKE